MKLSNQIHNIINTSKSINEVVNRMISESLDSGIDLQNLKSFKTKSGIQLRKMDKSDQMTFGGVQPNSGFISHSDITIPTFKDSQKIFSLLVNKSLKDIKSLEVQPLEAEVVLICGKSDSNEYMIDLVFSDVGYESYEFAYFSKNLKDIERVINKVPKSFTIHDLVTLRGLGFTLLH
jgi:hypothetical protein